MNPEEQKQRRKDNILDSLYHHSQTRIFTSMDVLSRMLHDLRLIPATNTEDKLLEIIKEYKMTGKNLEYTVDVLYDLLYPPPSPSKKDKSDGDSKDKKTEFDYT